MFCTRCNINWASLWTEYDHTGDEQYDYCPCCKSSTDLVDNIEGARYFKTITGEIINAETNEQMMLPTKELPPVKKEYLKHDFVDRKEMERREDEVIEAYLKQFQ